MAGLTPKPIWGEAPKRAEDPTPGCERRAMARADVGLVFLGRSGKLKFICLHLLKNRVMENERKIMPIRIPPHDITFTLSELYSLRFLTDMMPYIRAAKPIQAISIAGFFIIIFVCVNKTYKHCERNKHLFLN